MTDADVHRSTPGYVYGVGMHSSGQTEGTPTCSCPCHLAHTPRGARGWACDRCWTLTMCGSYPPCDPVEYSHEQAVADGKANPRPYMVSVPDYYFLTRGNNLDDAFPRRHFKTEEMAARAADKLNERDVLASLDLTPLALVRRERLKQLGDTFWVRYGEGHSEARWPKEPGRYAVESYSERYGESFWETVETLDDVATDADRVYDLDEGRDVPFTVRVDWTAA